MEKEIYFYNKFKELGTNKDLKTNLIEIANLLHDEYGMNICFYELYGRRWSHLGGREEILVPDVRVKLNEKYGLMAENIKNEEYQNIIEALKRVVA